MSKNLKAEKKFFTSKCKEGDYINIKYEWKIMQRQLFLNLGADTTTAP